MAAVSAAASAIVTVSGAQPLAHPMRHFKKSPGFPDVERTVAGEVGLDDVDDFPRRGDMTTIRVDKKTASGIEWVTNTTVLRVLSQSFRSCSLR